VDGEDSNYISDFKKCASEAPIIIDDKIRTCPEGFAYWFEIRFVEEIISAVQDLSDFEMMTAKFCGYDSSVLLKNAQGKLREVEMSKAAASVLKRQRELHATFDLIFNEVRFQIQSSLSNLRLFSRFNALDLSIDHISRFQLLAPLIGDDLSNFVLPHSLDYLDLSINHTRSSALSFKLAFPVDPLELYLTDGDPAAMPKPIANLSSPKKAKTRQHRKFKKSKEKVVETDPLRPPLKKPKAKWQRKATTATLKDSAEVPLLVSPAHLTHSHMANWVPY
jgi:hypothetical protein